MCPELNAGSTYVTRQMRHPDSYNWQNELSWDRVCKQKYIPDIGSLRASHYPFVKSSTALELLLKGYFFTSKVTKALSIGPRHNLKDAK